MTTPTTTMTTRTASNYKLDSHDCFVLFHLMIFNSQYFVRFPQFFLRLMLNVPLSFVIFYRSLFNLICFIRYMCELVCVVLYIVLYSSVKIVLNFTRLFPLHSSSSYASLSSQIYSGAIFISFCFASFFYTTHRFFCKCALRLYFALDQFLLRFYVS